MAKRITAASVDWAFISEIFPPTQVARVQHLRTASDKYVRELATKPADLPKIDWAHYKSKITSVAVLESLKKSYEELKIPYPSDQGALAVAESINSKMLAKSKATYEEVVKQAEISLEKLKELERMPLCSEMTIEEFSLAFPEYGYDHNNPKLWPLGENIIQESYKEK